MISSGCSSGSTREQLVDEEALRARRVRLQGGGGDDQVAGGVVGQPVDVAEVAVEASEVCGGRAFDQPGRP